MGGWTFVTRISLTTLQATGMGFFGLYGSTAALASTLKRSTSSSAIPNDSDRHDPALGAAGRPPAVEVDQPVVADGAPAAVLHVPASDLRAFCSKGSGAEPVRPGRAAVQDDLVHGMVMKYAGA
jgi:hypothetical protein